MRREKKRRMIEILYFSPIHLQFQLMDLRPYCVAHFHTSGTHSQDNMKSNAGFISDAICITVSEKIKSNFVISSVRFTEDLRYGSSQSAKSK